MPACPRCRRTLPPWDVLVAATATRVRSSWTVVCACGTHVQERWQSRLAAHAAALAAAGGVWASGVHLPRWAAFGAVLAAWTAAHAVTVPLRRWRAVRPGDFA